jgi:uncharacterized membrane protein
MYKGTRAVVTTGILAGIAVLLAVTQFGFVPFPGVRATFMHIPVILGSLVNGMPGGSAVGLIFGVYSFLYSPTPMFRDPLVSILPRILIGVTPYLTYVALRRTNDTFAVGTAAVVGTLTNTVGVLGMAVLRGYMAPAVALTVGVTNAGFEAVAAVLVVVAVMRALQATRGGTTRKANL